jgi:hypothetical protein
MAAFALALAVPAVAAAATKPGVSTGGAAQVTINSATLTGQVNPHAVATVYWFQYGTTKSYGSRTANTSAGKGAAAVAAAAQVAGLGSNTKYHYRLVARSSAGTTVGGDRTFTTQRQPLGLTLTATPNPVIFGGPSTLSGALSGSGNAGRAVQLQQNPFPFTAGFSNIGNAQVTNAQGGFAFALLSVPSTTQYRVIVTDKKSVVSPVITVSVNVVVRTKVDHTHVARGGRVRFSGTVRPALPHVPFAIQKLNSKRHWVTIAGSVTRPGGKGFCLFRKTVRLHTSGKYRVYVGNSGTFAQNKGRTVELHVG